MRTATDFDQYYAVEDPWRISRSTFRDRVLRRAIGSLVEGKSVLELGCGEGHLTKAVFGDAKCVIGVDFSDLAISRARSRNLRNARFRHADILDVSFEGFDTLVAIECLYYLSLDDQEKFFEKVKIEHPGRPLIVTGPIIGGKYFTHGSIMATFRRHGFTVQAHKNLNVYRQRGGIVANFAAVLVRLPFQNWLLDWIPERLIYQRCYLATASGK